MVGFVLWLGLRGRIYQMSKIFLILCFLLFNFLDADVHRTIPLEKLFQTDLSLKNKTFKVWLAIDSEQKKEGLSSLLDNEVANNEGMLFIYPFEEKLKFWMKNTLFDLDIAYIKSDGTIIDIYRMPKQSTKIFSSSSKVAYVLELRAGEFEKIDLKVNDKIVFSPLIQELSTL